MPFLVTSSSAIYRITCSPGIEAAAGFDVQVCARFNAPFEIEISGWKVTSENAGKGRRSPVARMFRNLLRAPQ